MTDARRFLSTERANYLAVLNPLQGKGSRRW